MASGSDNFSFNGPLHLTRIDWNNKHHRRSVAASLVEGVYVLEGDRQKKRQGLQSLAPPWWKFFHFKLIRQLVDDDDSSIFGAIFEYKPPVYSYHLRDSFGRSPGYVIAFRGTLCKGASFVRDLGLDIHVIRNGLHRSSRFGIGMKAVQDMVAYAGDDDSKVWLAGHSLGAAMAMLVGKNMAKTGKFLEAFLFNPPFFSVPIERIKNRKVKQGLRLAITIITAGLVIASAVKGEKRLEDDNCFAVISGWIPNLFVNQVDHICCEYIGYFEHRMKMDKIGYGAGHIAKIASRYSLGGLALSEAGIKGIEPAEPLHLLPSANLIVNLNPPSDFLGAHALWQWWKSDLDWKHSVYKYN